MEQLPLPHAAPRAGFFLPNAKVGVEYCATLEGRDASGQPVNILDLSLPEELGLMFDSQTGRVSGSPRSSGDYRLPLRWSPAAKGSYPGECLLIVNPDPKSLWKQLEPPADAPYPKPHQDCRLITGESGLQLLAASRRGRSHEHQGSFRDDDFLIQADDKTGWSLLLVADGAGSAQFSREGARVAVTSAAETLNQALGGDLGEALAQKLSAWDSDPGAAAEAIGREFHALFHQAGTRAVQAIEQAAKTQSAKARDYATTLLAAVVKRENNGLFLASFWMGDGAIAAYGPAGKVRLMGTPDGGEFAGQTRFLDAASLADPGFAKRIGIGYFQDIEAVLLMTDGVSDPRFETDNGLKDPVRWDALWDELKPLLAASEPAQALVDWLHFFSPGHHDDRTIALLRPAAGTAPMRNP
ncbi:PP2C family serine/threonine-protein phosphatase [Thiorhodovibrio frisius]|uniref:PPM-type phosphatase domain-containing protein n=1 Tax=Thiorhodovibrio frisius TaxID=631362 RepID=H8Z2H7_9GAMM|nr:PP2C family serine/threonine-protein phosphatase [Thiorhodovibrio frisius]EIC21632.1 hypothetical protein Thi970DRAFT_01848 [Thiorhodovibrio frisius]WPL21598.1 hypothetical protein Thiofri_01724 [Thiorhodovibrio frisius]